MLLTIYQIWQGLKKEYNIICLQFYVNWLRNKALNPRIRLRYKILSHIENNAPLIHKTQRKKELKQKNSERVITHNMSYKSSKISFLEEKNRRLKISIYGMDI